MTNYNVRAVRWEHGWELHIEGLGVTQSRALGWSAERMIRDYIHLDLGVDAARDAVIHITPDLGPLGREVADVKSEATAAEDAQRKAAAHSRKVARELKSTGLSGNDVATVLGVSPQRASQLLKEG